MPILNKKILLISDTHRFLDHLPRLVKKYRRSVDLMIHCGDSALPKNDPIMSQFDIAVRGNHDEEAYPAYVKHEHILVTHGHLYNVYDGYDELIPLCQFLVLSWTYPCPYDQNNSGNHIHQSGQYDGQSRIV